jgi:hypothetical protein
LRAGGTIFLSVSGIDSELSLAYGGARDPVEKRWVFLGEEMSAKHGIHHSVCLYSLPDFQKLLVDSGFIILKAWVSDFGNIKLMGKSNGK